MTDLIIRGGSRGDNPAAVVSYSKHELQQAQQLLGVVVGHLDAAADALGEAYGAAQSLHGFDAVISAGLAGRLSVTLTRLRYLQSDVGSLIPALALAEGHYDQTEWEINNDVVVLRDQLEGFLLSYVLESAGPYPSGRLAQDFANHWPVYLTATLTLPLGRGGAAAGRGEVFERMSGLTRGEEHGGVASSSLTERFARAIGWGSEVGRLTARIEVVEIRETEGAAGGLDGGAAHGTMRGSMQDLLANQGAADQERSGPGAMAISSTKTAARTVHTVSLPGTQTGDGSAPEENPWGVGGLVDGLTGDSRHATAAVLDALQGVGAEPGDRVVLTGYSQGGIHAANIAANALFQQQYDVAGVVTLGAPVGATDIPESAFALHFQHAHDAVPGATGEPTGTSYNHLVVSSVEYAPGQSPGVDADSTLSDAHAPKNYEHMAMRGALSGDPDLERVYGGLAGVYAGATSTRRYSVSLRRDPGAVGARPAQEGRPGPASRGPASRDGRGRPN
ncbi:hypothetical protein [Zhihengliuella sp.]|uniref:hypothetical protein n=1 Tax=Zhihengliuella sp. TaxID=1954483 RepID=UPI002811A284|nr:hypothetical protein [Zhihengliuella sp.]